MTKTKSLIESFQDWLNEPWWIFAPATRPVPAVRRIEVPEEVTQKTRRAQQHVAPVVYYTTEELQELRYRNRVSGCRII